MKRWIIIISVLIIILIGNACAATPEVILNKKRYQSGDMFQLNISSTTLYNCDYYFINPDGREGLSGSGECGNAKSYEISEILKGIRGVFGEVVYGTYTAKVIMKTEGKQDIIKTALFEISEAPVSYSENCVIESGNGFCTFLGQQYKIKNEGCFNNMELEIYRDEISEKFENVNTLDDINLVNNVRITILGAPCATYRMNLKFSIEARMNIAEAGRFVVGNGSIIRLNNVVGIVQEITKDSSIIIVSNDGQRCSIKEGEFCYILNGTENHKTSKNMKITGSKIYANLENLHNSIGWIDIEILNERLNVIEPELKSYTDMPNVIEYSCNGCQEGIRCYSFGYVKDNKFCLNNFNFVNQKTAKMGCSNSFECLSNKCIKNKCKEKDVIDKISGFFKWLFSGHN